MKIVIEGIPPLDGEYELDEGYFTNRELHIIKTESGVRAGELEDALQASDTDLVLALAYITLLRHGKRLPGTDILWDAHAGSIKLIGDEGSDAVPPAEAPLKENDSGDA